MKTNKLFHYYVKLLQNSVGIAYIMLTLILTTSFILGSTVVQWLVVYNFSVWWLFLSIPTNIAVSFFTLGPLWASINPVLDWAKGQKNVGVEESDG